MVVLCLSTYHNEYLALIPSVVVVVPALVSTAFSQGPLSIFALIANIVVLIVIPLLIALIPKPPIVSVAIPGVPITSILAFPRALVRHVTFFSTVIANNHPSVTTPLFKPLPFPSKSSSFVFLS